MSRSMDRHRRAYKEGLAALEELLGDSETTSTATSAIADLLKAGGGLAAEQQAKKEKEAKDKADKATYDAAHKDETEAAAAAKDARKKADEAAIKARASKAKADAVERDPKGPMHLAAQKDADMAALIAADARAAEERAGLYRPSSLDSSAAGQATRSASAGVPTWVWWMAGIAGAGVTGLVGYKLLSGGRK